MRQVVEKETESRPEQDKESRAFPRLLDLHQAGEYTNTSYWTVRDWVLGGLLPVVRLPGARLRNKAGKVVSIANAGRSMRKVLIDRQDLDDLIERSKQL